MTNRQWIIQKLIDMSDEEFADRLCGKRNVWSCDECVENKVNGACTRYCEEHFREWLKQEHKVEV